MINICDKGHISKNYSTTGICDVCVSNQKSKDYVKNHKERILLTKAKNRAKTKNIEFNIDINDVIIPDVCPILGIDIIKDTGGRHNKNSPSIDRIDNTRGYTKDNIRIISFRANNLKSDGTLEEFLKIVDYLEKFENSLEGVLGKILNP